MSKKCGIYLITNKINNKKYIGSSIHIDERLIMHKYHLNGKHHNNKILQSDWDKYKEENFIFEILELCPSNKLVEREQDYINKFKSKNSKFGYNKATPHKKSSIDDSRIPYATTLEESLVKKLRVTAAEEERKANDLLEELLQAYFKKKEKK